MMDCEKVIHMILGEAVYVHKSIGPGLLEHVYKNCLAYRLQKIGLRVDIETPIPVFFEEVQMGCGYRSDLVVENQIIIEVKSIDSIAPIHIAQVLTYCKFLNLRYGLLLNFNVTVMKYGIKRVLNGYS